MTRPSWDTYFLDLVEAVARRGTCDRGRPGAVLVRDNHLLTAGYAGSPRGLPHCHEAGHWLREVRHEDGVIRTHCVRTVHSEMNAIIQAARHGVSTLGATCYTTMAPCLDCAKALINAGIVRVVAVHGYQAADTSREWLEAAGVELVVMDPEAVDYK